MVCKECIRKQQLIDSLFKLANDNIKDIEKDEEEVERLSKEFNEVVKQLRKGL